MRPSGRRRRSWQRPAGDEPLWRGCCSLRDRGHRGQRQHEAEHSRRPAWQAPRRTSGQCIVTGCPRLSVARRASVESSNSATTACSATAGHSSAPPVCDRAQVGEVQRDQRVVDQHRPERPARRSSARSPARPARQSQREQRDAETSADRDADARRAPRPAAARRRTPDRSSGQRPVPTSTTAAKARIFAGCRACFDHVPSEQCRCHALPAS